MGRSIARRAITKLQDRKKLELTASVYAKRANQRLRQLEQSLTNPLSSNAYKEIRDFAKDKRKFISTTKSGEFKFKTSFRKMSLEDLQEELKQLDTFLFEAKTSTVKGAKAHYSKIRKSIAKNRTDGKTQRVMDYFSQMTDNEFSEFWDYTGIKSLWNMYGSDQAVKIIESAKEEGLSMEKINEVVTDAINADLTTVSEIEDYMQLSFDDMVDNI